MHHDCIVVPDLDAAVVYYELLGVSPWKDVPSLLGLAESSMSQCDLASLSYRACELKNLQLQLCQPVEGTTPQRRFLEQKGSGFHHLGFTIGPVDSCEHAGIDAGLDVRANGRRADGHGFTYFDSDCDLSHQRFSRCRRTAPKPGAVLREGTMNSPPTGRLVLGPRSRSRLIPRSSPRLRSP